MAAVGNYVDENDVSNWPSGTTEAERQAAINRGEQIFEAAVGTAYRPKPFDMKLNGNDRDRLILPLAGNIVNISAVYVWGELLDPTWYTFDHNGIHIDLTTSGAGISSPEREYLLGETEGYGLFRKGFGNIRVVGTYGAAAVPEWATKAVKILVEAENDPSLYQRTLEGSETIGNYSYNLSGGAGKAGGPITGIREADDLIRLFRRGKPIIMAR